MSCKICGSPIKPTRQTCSVACRNKLNSSKVTPAHREKASAKMKAAAPERLEKARKTMLERYGVENPFQLDASKEASRLYHTEHKDEVQAKREATTIENYGVENPFNIPKCRARATEAVKQYQQTDEAKRRRANLAQERRVEYGVDDFTDFPINGTIAADRLGCSPSHANREMRRLGFQPTNAITLPEQKVKEILDSLGVAYAHRDRSMLGGKRELDFYIESHALAIEVNGLYWHSVNRGTPEKYHQDKRVEAEAKGIQLIQFWDSQILQQPRIVESIIRSRLQLCDRRLFARKLELRVCDSRQTAPFFKDNHLMGAAPAATHVGLFLQDELVCAMTLSANRFSSNNELEIVRFATKLNHSVTGGFSKLLSWVEKTLKPNKVASFVDQMAFSGSSLTSSGFRKVNETLGYMYWLPNKGIKVSRYQAQKHKLAALIGPNYNERLTETQNMFAAGYHKVFDAGQAKFLKDYTGISN